VSWIVKGVEEVSVLDIWEILSSGNGCANVGVAPESTSERVAKCDDDAVVNLYPTV
jgi:hypothetical protein